MENVYAFVQNPQPLENLFSAPIYKIMQKLNAGGKLNQGKDDGFDNFIMYPMAETLQSTHFNAEEYFINELNSIHNGYNVRPKGVYGNSLGRTLSIHDKIVRSDKILAIHLNHKKLVFSDSMKLFADFIGTSKDIVKNHNRSGRPYKGWFIFYIDKNKRFYIWDYFVMGDNIGFQTNGRSRNHSEESKKFYTELYTNISSYIESRNSELFSDFAKLDSIVYSDDK